MPSRDPLLYLEDIAENIEAARGFTMDMSLEEFLSDRRTLYATIRALEIISEASRNIPEDLKQRYPEVPWRDVADAGNVYRHAYPAVDPERVWNTVEHGLERLHDAINTELERRRERERNDGTAPDG